jgi:nicotinamidase-related amidase
MKPALLVIDIQKAFFEGDPITRQSLGNAFNKTPLEAELRALGVDTAIITGYCAEYCVLSTYRGAKDLDLTPIILCGSLASDIPENIVFVESISDVISYGALKKVLGYGMPDT